MRVLVLGATGFIGNHVANYLIAKGCQVIVGARDTKRAGYQYPCNKVIEINFRKPNTLMWARVLKEVDAVINCIGILCGDDEKMQQVHYDAPMDLLRYCDNHQIKLLHFSGLAASHDPDGAFSKTKQKFEQAASEFQGAWCILRPSLVYSYGSDGGTSLMRAAAALPWIMPLPADGHQKFCPIHMDDVCEAVHLFLTQQKGEHRIIDVVGPRAMSCKEILQQQRQWMGLKPALMLPVPMPILNMLVSVISTVSAKNTIHRTIYRFLRHDHESDCAEFKEAFEFEPRAMSVAMQLQPSHIQDRWHAQLYFLAPVIKFVMALFWIVSGLVPMFGDARIAAVTIIEATGINTTHTVLYLSCFMNIALGAALYSRFAKEAAWLQLCAIFLYTLVISVSLPSYWLDPFGAILKNIPVLMLTLVWLILRRH